MLDLDRPNSWNERSEALQAGARRRIRARMALALGTVALVATTAPQVADAKSKPHVKRPCPGVIDEYRRA